MVGFIVVGVLLVALVAVYVVPNSRFGWKPPVQVADDNGGEC